jgi:prenyl protein peptidase
MKVLLLNTILFIGKYYFHYLNDEFYSLRANVVRSFTSLENFKSYWFAPWLEEYVFRVLCLFIYEFGIDGAGYSVALNSVLFSLAHGHHYAATWRKSGFKAFVVTFANHSIMTFVFGAYSSMVMVRTESFWAVALLHSYCNLIGGPQYSDNFGDRQNKYLKNLYVGGVVIAVG